MSNLGGGLKNIDWNATRLEKFEKNFYREDPRVTSRSERDVEDFRRSKEMKVSSRGKPSTFVWKLATETVHPGQRAY